MTAGEYPGPRQAEQFDYHNTPLTMGNLAGLSESILSALSAV